MDIIDVGPTRLNTNASDIGHSVTGRTLSIACSPDGKELYAGSYSNIWTSQDGGQKWEQLTWPQPDPLRRVRRSLVKIPDLLLTIIE